MIKLSNLQKIVDSTTVLDNEDPSINFGEIVVVVSSSNNNILLG